MLCTHGCKRAHWIPDPQSIGSCLSLRINLSTRGAIACLVCIGSLESFLLLSFRSVPHCVQIEVTLEILGRFTYSDVTPRDWRTRPSVLSDLFADATTRYVVRLAVRRLLPNS